jgi:hypothetical protein
MKTRFAKAKSTPKPLTCSACGNTERFFELMDVETHLVDGNLTYLHLVDAIVDHYVCCECGEPLQPVWAKLSKQLVGSQNK